MSSDNSYIALCKKLICEKLSLDSNSLIQRDYEYMSKVIFEKSGIDLSTATLRRIWTAKGQKIPQAKTLDALSNVLGYDGWHTFKMSNQDHFKKSNSILRTRFIKLIIIILIPAIAIWVWQKFPINENANVSLSPEVASHIGVPATIGFYYDISEIQNDEVLIQLSWNPYERTVLNPEDNFYTGTYFYPDYHQAKLFVEDEVVASSYVHITTSGWHGLVMKESFDISPIYIDSVDFLLSDRLSISKDLSTRYQLDELDQLFSVFTLSNEILGKISGDDFELTSTIRGLGKINNSICNQMDLVIKGEKGTIRIPISNLGCYGVTTLKCSDAILSGKTNDLSDLSADLQKSIPISLSIQNHQLQIIVDNNEPFNVNYSDSIGSLKVIKFLFTGYGEVTEFSFGLDSQSIDEVSKLFN